MTTRQPGLRKRMALEARRIFHQHEQLDLLYAEAAKALASASPSGSVSGPGGDDAPLRALHSLRDGLLAHFEIEERTHFPALHGLSPDSDQQLVKLVGEHTDFRAQLVRIEARLTSGSPNEAQSELEALAVGLARHEELEEALFTQATTEKG